VLDLKRESSCLGGIIWIGRMGGRLWLLQRSDAIDVFLHHGRGTLRVGQLEVGMGGRVAWRCHLLGCLFELSL
jgi:hypothetical protein